jgi:hypothetical protein
MSHIASAVDMALGSVWGTAVFLASGHRRFDEPNSLAKED